jgi:DNA-binding CsgD family transcriptional regulator
MYLQNDIFAVLKNVVKDLYSRPFDESLIIKTSETVCRLTGADYFAFYNLVPQTTLAPTFLSNNPSDFLPVYSSVASEDFLLEAMVTSHKEYVLRREFDLYDKQNQNFINAVQHSRPISDIAYMPMEYNGFLNAFFALGKAELDNVFFSEPELDIYRFIVSFMNDALLRSKLPEPDIDSIAYLDFKGNILQNGCHIGEIFNFLFGNSPCSVLETEQKELKRQFQTSYASFLHGNIKIGMDQIILIKNKKRYSFRFNLVNPGGITLPYQGTPIASVKIIESPIPPGKANPSGMINLNYGHAFTPREYQILDGIYQGNSNKLIAWNLGISESTVKRHVYNIFEKTGYRSRVELLLGLSRI